MPFGVLLSAMTVTVLSATPSLSASMRAYTLVDLRVETYTIHSGRRSLKASERAFGTSGEKYVRRYSPPCCAFVFAGSTRKVVVFVKSSLAMAVPASARRARQEKESTSTRRAGMEL